MLTYSSTLSVDSQTFPGVRFTLHKMSEARRAAFTLQTAELQSRLRSLNRQAMKIIQQVKDAAEPGPELDGQIEDLHAQTTALVSGELNPAYVRWGLKSITGLAVLNDDDAEAAPVEIKTAEALIADGPPELFAEICGAIISASSMTEADLKNFKLPSISGGQTDGSGKTMTADSASNADGSGDATALNTSQN